MTPLRARYRRGKQIVRCWFGQHEDTTHAQEARPATAATADVPAQPAQPAIIRHRCLHCGRLTEGWSQDGPRYAYREGMDRPVVGVMLHNHKLQPCPCHDCDRARVAEARAARRAKRPKVQPMRRSA